jgi:hypothetical protein
VTGDLKVYSNNGGFMAYLTYKVDAELLRSPDFFKLTDKQRSTFFSLLSVLEKGSIEVAKLEFLMREKLSSVLKGIELAGFIRIENGFVYQTGKGAFRYTDTKRVEKWRQENKKEGKSLIKNCRVDVKSEQVNTVSQADSQDHLQPSASISKASVVVNTVPSVQKRAPKTHEEGVRESMVSDGVDTKLADEWLAQRISGVKYGKNPVTARAWAGVKREVDLAKWPLNAAVERMIEMQWQSFKACYVVKDAIPGSAAALAGKVSGSGLSNIPEGYYRDGNGRNVKRQLLSL